ncbi:hypothetical protein Pan216_08030 [Planctomycetes bacterium Pan216]|uniref:Bacterial Ig-like domain (Group 2) n=1 Tax=Kolteria novifilia TaxID=2527975 RepID=A0A518AZ08_9BACT|nr:hypothetical protein Pan216_08030 [Planctomycetes bacterium Pan216]
MRLAKMTSALQCSRPIVRLRMSLLPWLGMFVALVLPGTSRSAPGDVATVPAVSSMRFDLKDGRIVGRDGRIQLLVTGSDPSGRAYDLTRDLDYRVEPKGIVEVDKTGYVRPMSDGEVTVVARTPSGVEAQTKLVVSDVKADEPPSFHRRIMPILDKYGCTSCHGTPRGQNGFKLSLFGFDPQADYRALVKELGGRRISRYVPEESLILLKATASISHGGAKRFARDSDAHGLLVDWIGSGAPYGETSDGEITRIEVLPRDRVMDPEQSQQLRVIAHFANGDVEDMTRLAKFHSNDETLAEVSHRGVVSTHDLRGDFAVTVSLREHVGVFRGTIPFGYASDGFPEPRNFIDKHVFARLKYLGMPPSAPCTDLEFLRRVTIDLAGRLPTLAEIQQFEADKSEDKRDRLIDRLLAGDDYAKYFANKWSLILRNHQKGRERKRGSFSFHHWVVESFRNNRPYDEFVREIVTASGDVTQNPPATWYQEVITPEDSVENLCQLFLGVRITCARCHHHPFERWSQKDYYSLAAFFARVGRKPNIHGDKFFENRIHHKRGTATYKHPNTGEVLKPTVLGGSPLEIAPDDDPRELLAEWLVDPENPFFATVLVNRYWNHFFGMGIVDPIDDLRDTNPPSNPELLEALREHFVKSGFDLKALIREICRSKTYQLSAKPNEFNLEDSSSFSRFQPRRMNAEVLLDAIDQIAENKTNFSGMPRSVRAIELPDSSTGGSEFLELFGRPNASSPSESERSQESDLRQSLFLLTSTGLEGKLASNSGTAARLAKDAKRSDEEKLRELYLRAYGRPPRPEEMEIAKAHIESFGKDKKKAYEGLLWAIINTKEFMYNH